MLSNEAEDHSDQQTEVEYTGVINLSGRHLKRIECLPEGVSPYTLLLSNNEISKVENLQYFVHLQQLSLSGNHIVDIKGISTALSLRVLDLSNNSIVTIEGVSSLRNLEWLNLSGNSIEQIENLDRNYNLYHLDLSDNSIAALAGLKTLSKLKTLLMHGNLISSLEGIKDQVSSTVLTLSLADNEISDLNEVVHLSSLTNLEQLSLVNNPCVLASSSWRLEVNYRPYLVYCCGNLRNLDGNLVNDKERMLARLLDQAFKRIGHPSQGQHVQLVSILHHLCSDSDPVDQTTQADDLDCNMLLESESFYIPVPTSDVEQTESDDHIMTEEEAIRLFSLAATIIQAHVRGYLVRKKFDFCQYRRRKYAAASIQAVWKGYRARTRDIKVINIRNELRVRRLISIITNLYSALEREHEDAVKSREQVKTAIKYLWHQITEQKRLNQIQLHKEQVKAAIKIQAWWRGCMCKKAFPRMSVNRDKVTILFSLCRKLQMQLDVVTSKINEITKDEKQSKEFRLKDQTALEGQGQFYDRVRQLDSSQDNITLSPDVEAGHTASSALDQLNAKPGEYAAHLLDDAQARIMKEGDLVIPGNNVPTPGQLGREEKLVCLNDSAPLARTEGEMVPSSPEQVDHEAAVANTHKLKPGFTEESSLTDLEEGNIVTSALKENNRESSSYFESNTECNESDEQHSLDRLRDHDPDVVTYSTHSEEDLQGESRVLSPVTQEESRNETEAIAFEVQVGQLEEDMVLPAGPPATDVVSLESQLTEEVPIGDGSAEEALHVSIPEIIVSSPVPTDDEGSDAGSTFEGDANDVQRKVEDNETKRQSTDDKHPGVDSSREMPSCCQEKEGHVSDTDTYTDQTKENTCPKQESDISRKYMYHEINLMPFRSKANFSSSKEASTSEKRGEEGAATGQSGCPVPSESAHVPNLGERASSLLSQLRSEIASMKTARLSNASPIQAADSAGDASKESQQRDKSQPAPQERDSSQLPAVTYRLPLFEDVDSACSSFSLDDFLSDTVTEEALNSASETNHVHEGAGDI